MGQVPVLEVGASSGGTYSVYEATGGHGARVEYVEKAPRGGLSISTLLVSAALCAGVLVVMHYVVGSFSSLGLYTLRAAPCVHPVAGLAVGYLVAKRRANPIRERGTVTLGRTVRFDGEDQGALVRVELDIAARRVVLVAEGAQKRFDCERASGAASLADLLEELGRSAAEEVAS